MLATSLRVLLASILYPSTKVAVQRHLVHSDSDAICDISFHSASMRVVIPIGLFVV